VVILGQDPYHGPGQAHGLCFSVPDGGAGAASLVNIYKELESDLGVPRRASGNLEHWARQGVLLLNTSLTVEAARRAAMRARAGRRSPTPRSPRSRARGPSVFILWGNHARNKAQRVPSSGPGTRHLVLTSPHPSPLSAHAGFLRLEAVQPGERVPRGAGAGRIDW
jgi:uracil-DNA glycosylase